MKIILVNEQCLVFDAETCSLLRTKFRIVGETIGNRNLTSGKKLQKEVLPMYLSKESVKLCIEEKLIEIPNSENFNFPQTKDEKLRFLIFKDLWKKGYYVTLGSKFGGDFLIYGGDPLNYHAQFIVLCLEPNEFFQTHKIASLGRLGNTVKKDILLSTYDENVNCCDYLIMKWHK
eukprot:gene4547-7931_t